MKRLPAILIILASGMLLPCMIVALGTLGAVKHPETGELHNLVEWYPVQVLLAVVVSLFAALLVLGGAVFRPKPMRWWAATIFALAILILSVLGFIGLIVLSGQQELGPPWTMETLMRRIIGSQPVFAIASAALLIVAGLRIKHPRTPQA